MTTVLVVDDERRIAQIARDYLEHAGFAVITASEGRDALARARTDHPDLVVLDLGLPNVDGLDVAKTLRRESDVPIIMSAAPVAASDRLIGLAVGADDYITKPFSPRELVARVQAVLRRTRGGSSADVIRLADLVVDVPRLKVTRDGRPIELTTTEFQLVSTMARHPGRVFTRAQLLDAVRGVEVDAFERAIDAHIKNVRRKLERDSRKPRYVLTVYGVGYKFTDS